MFSDESKIQILQPTANSFFYLDRYRLCRSYREVSETEKVKFKCPADKDETRNMIFIMFESSLCGFPRDEIIYTIAHEFAHVYLNHPDYAPAKDKVEIAADMQVIECGFEKELRASNHSYIYGKHDNAKPEAY